MIIIPVFLDDEASEIANIIGMDKAVLEDNWNHMEGNTCYMFEPGGAKKKSKMS